MYSTARSRLFSNKVDTRFVRRPYWRIDVIDAREVRCHAVGFELRLRSPSSEWLLVHNEPLHKVWRARLWIHWLYRHIVRGLGNVATQPKHLVL